MSEFAEKLRSIQFAGAPRRPKTVVRDGRKVTELVREDGSSGGFRTEHGSGRVDINVLAEPAKAETLGAS